MFQTGYRKALTVGIFLLCLWLAIRYLVPIFLPLLLGGLMAVAAEPLVRFWQSKGKLSRTAATAIGVTVALLVLILCTVILGSLLLRELRVLAEVAPNLEDTASEGLNALQNWLVDLADKTPPSISPLLNRSIENLFSDDGSMTEKISSRLLTLVADIVTKVPESLLGIGTWLLASFMISAKLPAIGKQLRARLPESWYSQWLPMLRRLKGAILGWLLAQCKLIGITFGVLCLCFFVLQISYAPIWAFLISLVDALPVLGTGTVLLPWSLVCFLQGDNVRAIGLLGAYAVALTLRSIAEPRLVGKQLGLDPLVTLGAMYAGYRLLGIVGMILSPLLAVTVIQMLAVRKENR